MNRDEQIKIAKVGESMWYFRALHRHLMFVLTTYAPRNPGWILDGGSGAGGFSKSLERAFPGAQKLAADIDCEAIKHNPRSSKNFAVAASINQLPILDETFSAYISADIIYHAAVNPEDFAREAHRCMAPGGVLVVNVPAYQWLFSAHDRQVNGVRRYTLSELRSLLTNHGFEIRYGTYWNTLLFPLLVLWRKVMARNRNESDLRYFPKPLEFFFNAVMVLEYTLLKAGIRLPFGGSVLVAAERV